MSGKTIFALSSGQPPAAIAIIRISGASAGSALARLAGGVPAPRRAAGRDLVDPETGELLDRALVLFFAGPHSATGEDLAELHLHGGRAVVRSVERALATLPDMRWAEPGEFTRRAFANGRIDLAEAEGLADLLFAESEWQRRSAMLRAGGAFSRHIENWREALLELSARVEAELDFSDEDDVGSGGMASLRDGMDALREEVEDMLARPAREKLREGIRVVLAGPPNAGKSTLLNALVERDAAIVSDIPGTTRDRIEVPVALSGIPFVFIDTAGLRERDADAIERIGIARARDAIAAADIVLWLGPEGQGPQHAGLWEVEAQVDRPGHLAKAHADLRVSAVTGEAMDLLVGRLVEAASAILPPPDSHSVTARERSLIRGLGEALARASRLEDLLAIGEELRRARLALDELTGRAHTEDMLDGLFGRFCIGK